MNEQAPPAQVPELPPPGALPLEDAKREAFCHEYLVDLKGGPAATRAGFTENPDAARVQGCRLLTEANVRDRIDFLTTQKNRLIGLNAEDVLRAINELATSDAALLFAPDGQFLPIHEIPPEIRRCIASVETETRYEVKLVDVKPQKGAKKGAKTKKKKKKVAIEVLVTKVKLWDKPKGLAKLGEHMALFARRTLVSAPDGGPVKHAVGVVTVSREQADAAYRNLGLGEFTVPVVVTAAVGAAPGLVPQPQEPKP